MRIFNLICPTRLGLIIYILFGTSLPAQERPGWGIEGDAGFGTGRVFLSGPFIRGEGALTDYVFGLGLVRFDKNGVPNLGFGYTHNEFRARGVLNYASSEAKLGGGFRVQGLIFKKYFTFFHRRRFSAGISGGLGIGSVTFAISSRDLAFRDKMFFVPFEILGQADFRISGRISFGPV